MEREEGFYWVNCSKPYPLGWIVAFYDKNIDCFKHPFADFYYQAHELDKVNEERLLSPDDFIYWKAPKY